jgi:hypothetical protein
MAVQVTIDGITGQTPYDIYICQSDGTACFYVTTTSTIPYVFNIPAPNDTSLSYMLKIKDGQGCTFNAIANVIS